MSKIKPDKKNAGHRKLSLNRETLRIISGERLEEVAGGWTFATTVFVTRVGCETDPAIYCGPLH